MKDIKENRNKEINDIISIVKLASLLFCGIIVYSTCFKNGNYEIVLGESNSLFWGAILFISVIALIYWGWLFFISITTKYKYKKIVQVGENVIFMIIFSTLIIVSNSYESEYKFLFLFIIITATIQLGMKHGLITACTSSLIILLVDLYFAPKTDTNYYFQNDLILVGVFTLTAWSLGYYVKVEYENLKEKEIKLKELSNELENKDKDRKYIEEILIKNQECYNMLIKNSPDAIFVHLDGKLVFVNESAVKLLGLVSADEISGKSIKDITPIDEISHIEEKFRQISKGNSITPFESNIIRGDGETIFIENISTSFVYERKSAILSILRDITYEKQVEKLQIDVENNMKLLKESMEINEYITEFFSNISHELKTPLNVIFSAIQVLMYNNENWPGENLEKQTKYLNMIKQNCYRLTRLINNILDMTRADSGFIKLHFQNYNIISVVEEIVLSVAPYVESKDMTLVFDTNVEEKIMAVDPDKIERIMLNILSNAIKFTNSGGEIFVNIVDNIDSVSISIKDTGVGIPEDKMQVIFERFGQVDKTFRRNREGSGIGLSLVKSFVEMHNGSIEIKSKLHVGSEFIINLPVVLLEEESSEENCIFETNIERINIEFSDIYSDIAAS